MPANATPMVTRLKPASCFTACQPRAARAGPAAGAHGASGAPAVPATSLNSSGQPRGPPKTLGRCMRHRPSNPDHFRQMIVMTDANKIAALRQHSLLTMGTWPSEQPASVSTSLSRRPGSQSRAHASRKGTDMLALQGTNQNLESIQLLLVIMVILAVVFWRTVLKIVLVFFLLIMIVLITSGVAALLQHAHHV